MGLAFISLLRSFANGGSSLTGLEAISNGVSSFRQPEAQARPPDPGRHELHARLPGARGHAAGPLDPRRPLRRRARRPWSPRRSRRSSAPARSATSCFYVVQLATMLILYTGGNTSFNGFPFLASFVAGDAFLPRQLTRRGHRLAFSNGILVLAGVALALVLVYQAQVNGLVALYAIGVFTGFTMAGSGMVKHHLDRTRAATGGAAWPSTASRPSVRHRRPDLRRGQVQGGRLADRRGRPAPLHRASSACTASTRARRELLETGAAEAAETPILRRHVVFVLVDRLDLATARALQYARTLTPDDLRAVHFDIDTKAARELEAEWGRLGLSRLPLDIIECPDRRLGRAAVELVAEATLDGDTECTVLLPRRAFARGWQRFLHDRTADKIAAVLGQVPHVSATIVPFNVAGRYGEQVRRYGRSVQEQAAGRGRATGADRVDAEGRSGLDRHGPARRAASARPTVLAADQTLAQRAGATTPIAAVRAAPAGPGGRPGEVGAGPAPGGTSEPRVRPERRHRRPAAGLPGPAQDRRASSRAPGWWPRAWWAPGAAGRPCSTPTSSWSQGAPSDPAEA